MIREKDNLEVSQKKFIDDNKLLSEQRKQLIDDVKQINENYKNNQEQLRQTKLELDNNQLEQAMLTKNLDDLKKKIEKSKKNMEDYELERATYEVDTKKKKEISDVKDGYSNAIKKVNVGRNKGERFSMKSGLDTVYRALLKHEQSKEYKQARDNEIERIKNERIQKIFGDQKEEKPPENEVANQEPEPKQEPQPTETSENTGGTGPQGTQQKALGKGKDIERGLSTDEINNYMRKYKNYLGTVPRNQIHLLRNYISPKQRKIAFIANTDPSNKPGRHWVAVYIDADKSINYFDSFGRPMPFDVRLQLKKIVDKMKPATLLKEKCNRFKLQGSTNNCGFFAMKFCIDMFNGKPFIDATPFGKISKTLKSEKEIRQFKEKMGKPFGYF